MAKPGPAHAIHMGSVSRTGIAGFIIGNTAFSPGSSYQLFPGDRLILSGESPGIDRAVGYLGLVEDGAAEDPDDFQIETVRVAALHEWAGHTLATFEPSTRLGVSVLAVVGPDRALSAPDAHRPLAPDDVLALGGPAERLRDVKRR